VRAGEKKSDLLQTRRDCNNNPGFRVADKQSRREENNGEGEDSRKKSWLVECSAMLCSAVLSSI
jgi:hypothetical protein